MMTLSRPLTTLALLAALLATAAANPADRRPPFFLPQRADTLILGGAGTPEAGSLESMPALAKFECEGNACAPGKKSALGEGERRKGGGGGGRSHWPRSHL